MYLAVKLFCQYGNGGGNYRPKTQTETPQYNLINEIRQLYALFHRSAPIPVAHRWVSGGRFQYYALSISNYILIRKFASCIYRRSILQPRRAVRNRCESPYAYMLPYFSFAFSLHYRVEVQLHMADLYVFAAELTPAASRATRCDPAPIWDPRATMRVEGYVRNESPDIINLVTAQLLRWGNPKRHFPSGIVHIIHIHRFHVKALGGHLSRAVFKSMLYRENIFGN